MMRKYGYVLILITVLAIIQPALLPSVGISGRMVDLVAIAVAAQAFTRSLAVSSFIAITAGILVDLFNSTEIPLGTASFSYLIMTLVVSQTVAAPHTSPWRPVIAAALAPSIALIASAFVLALTGEGLSWIQVPVALGSQVVLGSIFAALLVPVIDILDRPLYRDSLPLRVKP